MAVTDWQLVGLVQGADGTLTTQDGDPQMILEDVGSRVVRTISYTAEFDGEAREMCLYYTTKVGEDYLRGPPGVPAESGKRAVRPLRCRARVRRAAAGPLQPRGKQAGRDDNAATSR